MHTYIHTYKQTYIHAYIHAYIHTLHIYIYTYICIQIYTYICVHIYIYIYLCMYVCMYVCINICIHIYIYICIYIYVYKGLTPRNSFEIRPVSCAGMMQSSTALGKPPWAMASWSGALPLFLVLIAKNPSCPSKIAERIPGAGCRCLLCAVAELSGSASRRKCCG